MESPTKQNSIFRTEGEGMYEISLDNDEWPSFSKPSVNRPETFVRLQIQTLKPIDNFETALIPHILKFLDPADLNSCQRASWGWFKEASPLLYRKIKFNQLSGNRLKKFLKTLEDSVLSEKGIRKTKLNYAALIKSLKIGNIVFDDESPLQSWNYVRDVIALCSSSLVEIDLGIGDESFLELPSEYVYLHSEMMPNLRHLRLRSKCMRVPHKLVLELLRAAPIGQMKSIKFERCLTNFDGSGWFLITERGGKSLLELSLTPAVGPNLLGWDEKLFFQGIENVMENCSSLEKFDLSGHVMALSQNMLGSLVLKLPKLEDVFLPCTANDAHLFSLMGVAPWKHLHRLGLSCCCVDGEKKEAKNAISCNRFTDSVLISFLNHLLKVETPIFEVYLPAFLVSLKDGKGQRTDTWLSNCIHVTKREGFNFWFKDRIILSVPSSRMAIFF